MDLTKQEMLELLHREVVPALGCTEPVCVALASAGAAEALGADAERVRVSVSSGIYKNGMAVGIPGFDRVGLAYAAAIGALIAKPDKGLEVLSGLTPAIAARAIELVENGMVEVCIAEGQGSVYARTEVFGSGGTGLCLIRGGHQNIVLTQKNGHTLFEKPCPPGGGDPLYDKLRGMTLAGLRQLAQRADENELDFLLAGVRQNQKLSEYSRSHGAGVGIAPALFDMQATPLLNGSLLGQIAFDVASAVESRMDGCPHAVMSSAGSGNQGLITALTVSGAAEHLNASPCVLGQALAFAHLLNIYIKQFIGKLSPVCVCALSSCASTAAAVTLLMGGSDEQISSAVINVAGDLTGMICDGGKVGCALKLVTACSTALLCAGLAVRGVVIPSSNGICDTTAEQTIRNMGRVSEEGMKDTDCAILSVMLGKNAE